MQPVITNIYLYERISASCLFSFSNRPSVLDQKLNWNVTRFRETIYNWHFIVYRQLVLNPF